mgnify:CR=1 FL=1
MSLTKLVTFSCIFVNCISSVKCRFYFIGPEIFVEITTRAFPFLRISPGILHPNELLLVPLAVLIHGHDLSYVEDWVHVASVYAHAFSFRIKLLLSTLLHTCEHFKINPCSNQIAFLTHCLQTVIQVLLIGHLIPIINKTLFNQHVWAKIVKCFNCRATTECPISLMQLCIRLLNKRYPKQISVLTAWKERNWGSIAILKAWQLIINYDKYWLPLLFELEDIETKLLELKKSASVKAVDVFKSLWLNCNHAKGINKPFVLHLSQKDSLTIDKLFLSNFVCFVETFNIV